MGHGNGTAFALEPQMISDNAPVRRVKCVVWDLDGTLWNGVLAEGDEVELGRGVADIIRALDARGILQSLASRNDHAPAMARLRRFGVAEYFLYPQINWGAKSASLAEIARQLNVGLDAVAFIDDQAFERAEVASSHPAVLCLEPDCLADLLGMAAFAPETMTEEARSRRRMYLQDAARRHLEETFQGAPEQFLASLEMIMTITRAEAGDLDRLEELVGRTNQLNTTGKIYSVADLERFRRSASHELWVVALADRFGEYGKIGMALVEKDAGTFAIRTFLLSCRVMNRGIGSVFLHWLVRRGRADMRRVLGDWVANERNRMMLVTYRLAGFNSFTNPTGETQMEFAGASLAKPPAYLVLRAPEAAVIDPPGPEPCKSRASGASERLFDR